MAASSQPDRVTNLVLRSMRKPVLLLIAVYAIAIVGMVLVPGQDADGNPAHMSIFHAFYFLTYTATTTGFGEIPHAFSDAQRLWAIVSLYISVIGWFYAVASIIGLIQNPNFKQAVAERRFSKAVRHISEPFSIICGFGDTGSLLTRGLNDAGCMGVIIDSNPERIKALSLRDYRVTMPGLCADASLPKHLLDAGLRRRNCQAVVVLTPDEAINVKIAVMARLLNPSVQVICRSTSDAQEEYLTSMSALETVNPFDAFAKQLGSALRTPQLYALNEWLIRAKGATLDKALRPPTGTWILYGHGRMGRRLNKTLQQRHIHTVVIDPNLTEETVPGTRIDRYANQSTLRNAGIHQAAGIVICTNNDSDNLGFLLNARALNSDIFVVVRQNEHPNELAFSAANADLIMQPSLITARTILFDLISPLIRAFLDHLDRHQDTAIEEVMGRIGTALGDKPPQLWTIKLSPKRARAVAALINSGSRLTLGDILQDVRNRQQQLGCVPLVLKRGAGIDVLPASSYELSQGDEILFCGTTPARRHLEATLNNAHRLHYLVTGKEQPHGHLMRWITRRLAARQTAAPAGEV
jgi:Trk K+ transport system NAD-binding subunit